MKKLAPLLIAALLVVPASTEAHTLGYQKAKRAAKQKADRWSGYNTHIYYMHRQSRHLYEAGADWTWTDPDGCKECGDCYYVGDDYYCEDGPETRYCLMDMTVKFRSKRSSRLVVRITDHACF